jgi:hypothetical protein
MAKSESPEDVKKQDAAFKKLEEQLKQLNKDNADTEKKLTQAMKQLKDRSG